MNRRIRVLFVGPRTLSFVQQDLELLRKHFDVKVDDWDPKRKTLKDALKRRLYSMYYTLWADITFTWFANIRSAMAVLPAKILRKKTITVAGGYDVAAEPSINYGAMRFPQSKTAKAAKYVLEHTDLVLPVSDFTQTEVLKHSRPKRLKVVYNCVDAQKFKPKGEKDDNLVIIVANINKSNFKLKGVEIFVKTARLLPGIRFVLIGKHCDKSINYLRSIASSNVEFTGFLSYEKLLEYLQKAKVYVQISAYESFGVALAEAMLCQCVPVVTNRGAIPEVVGDAGYYVPYKDPKATAEAIKEALKSDKGKKARERIATKFPVQKREAELVKIINKLKKEGKG